MDRWTTTLGRRFLTQQVSGGCRFVLGSASALPSSVTLNKSLPLARLQFLISKKKGPDCMGGIP